MERSYTEPKYLLSNIAYETAHWEKHLHMKGEFTRKVALLLILLLLSPLLFFSANASNESSPPEPMFSIIWITDTQYLSEKFPRNFDTLCNWIANYSEALNVKAVIHTGDIVEHASSLREWNRANHSMSILLNNDIPYCWDAGNHDQLATSWYGKNFKAFNTTIMWEKNVAWESDKLDGKNTALHFKASNWDFLIINIEFQPNFEVLQWVNHLLELYPNYHTIIATHAYLNGTGGHDEWTNYLEQRYFEQRVLANHPNVFMTLNGHFMVGGRTNRTFIDNRHELFFNYQHTNGGQGDPTLRILFFSKEEDAIFVKTYNPVTNQFLTDLENQFTLDIPFFDVPNSYSDDLKATGEKPPTTPKFPSTTTLLLLFTLSTFIFILTRKKLFYTNLETIIVKCFKTL